MKERPILFKGDMVRAIMDGRKTQTRRVVNSDFDIIGERTDGSPWPWREDVNCGGDIWYPCPYGQPGDRLWVRETCQAFAGVCDSLEIIYADDLYAQFSPFTVGDENLEVFYRLYDRATKGNEKTVTVPSIHMPRWASRILLEITDVRVERLQDINEEDARAEGVHSDDDFPTKSQCPQCCGRGVHGSAGPNLGWVEVDCMSCDTAVKRFKNLWQSINGPDSWDANPWVWVVEFKRIDP